MIYSIRFVSGGATQGIVVSKRELTRPGIMVPAIIANVSVSRFKLLKSCSAELPGLSQEAPARGDISYEVRARPASFSISTVEEKGSFLSNY
jgi:hypothetical protein